MARTARDGKALGQDPAEILDEVGKLVGLTLLTRPDPSGKPAPDRPAEANRMTQQLLALEFQMQRKSIGDERTLDARAAQADTQLPDFRKR